MNVTNLDPPPFLKAKVHNDTVTVIFFPTSLDGHSPPPLSIALISV